MKSHPEESSAIVCQNHSVHTSATWVKNHAVESSGKLKVGMVQLLLT